MKPKPKKYLRTLYEKHHHMKLRWWERLIPLPNEQKLTKPIENLTPMRHYFRKGAV